MNQATPPVRIVVAEPSVVLPGVERVASDTARALAGLGREVELEFVADAPQCMAACRDQDVDLVVLDRGLGAEADSVLEALRATGPPVVVVAKSESNEEALEAFRNGAADCIRVGPEYRQLLPVVALEQIQRRRRARARGAAEQRIRWIEQLHDAIVTENPSGLLVLDGRERIVMVNPEFSRAFGVPRSQAEGNHFEKVLPADLIETGELRLMIAECGAARGSAPRLAQMQVDGSLERTFDVRAQRLDEEGRVLLVFSDVTDREALVKRVGDLQRYNENIIQNMNSAMLVVDRDGGITFANRTAEQILGAKPRQLTGRIVWDWFEAPDGERPLIARTLGDGLRFTGAEAVVRRGDDTLVPIGISCAPLNDVGGRQLGAVVIFQDLSEIKQLQRKVMQTEKMASIGQLAAGIAHEINNPMGFIHANLHQMADYLSDLRRLWDQVEILARSANLAPEFARQAAEGLSKLAEEVDIDFVLPDFAKAIRESQEGSERIRHIVQDLREFSHQDTAERIPADINQCLDSTASIAWTTMKHSVVLKKQYADLPRVSCFPMQLKQVFMNLLVNAYQAVVERVGDTGSKGEIHIRTAPEGDGVTISVQDSGVGIAPQNLDRIFDPFFTTKAVGAGTGLGLSTCYNIVRRHGGTMNVESQLGVGSTFLLWLPIRCPADLEHGG